jgi:hypothetical protein
MPTARALEAQGPIRLESEIGTCFVFVVISSGSHENLFTLLNEQTPYDVRSLLHAATVRRGWRYPSAHAS